MLRDIHTLHFQKPRNFDNSMNFIKTQLALKAGSVRKAMGRSIVSNIRKDYSTVTEHLRHKIKIRPT